MLDALRNWLNGKRNYAQGVVLYAQVSDNNTLLELFKKGPDKFTSRRLQEELLKICKALKGETEDTPEQPAEKNPPANNPPVNTELYNSCKAEADRRYKEVMNLRSQLFALAAPDGFLDVNKPDKIFDRRQLALDVVMGYQEVSALYDKADHVKEKGQLPDQKVDESNIDNIPDHQVFYKLDAIRKNFNKIVKLEQTPERVALVQKHSADIEKLQARWKNLQNKSTT